MPNEQQSDIAGKGAGSTPGGTEVGSPEKGATKPVGAGDPAVRVETTPFKPKGTSITLWGCGRRDGKDVNNSMGLVEAYRLILGV